MFLIINNLDIFRKNIESISEVNFSSDILNEFIKKLVGHLLSEKFLDKKKLNSEDFGGKFRDKINQINMNAPVKIIAKNKKEKEIVSMFDEIIDEMKKINLREKAEFLEGRVSSNLDEELYSELLSVRSQLKRG